MPTPSLHRKHEEPIKVDHVGNARPSRASTLEREYKTAREHLADREWRIDNLYWVKDEDGAEVHIEGIVALSGEDRLAADLSDQSAGRRTLFRGDAAPKAVCGDLAI